MFRSETRLKGWGNSIGVILPKDMLKGENLSIDDEVEVTVRKKMNPLLEGFGKLKGAKKKTSKSTAMLLREIDRELDSRLG